MTGGQAPAGRIPLCPRPATGWVLCRGSSSEGGHCVSQIWACVLALPAELWDLERVIPLQSPRFPHLSRAEMVRAV